MIVVSGTAAVILMIVGAVIWIAETANKTRRAAAQRAKNRELKAQAAGQARPRPSTGDQPPSMPYGM
jgi:Flp pilus assembly protein TadB